jgi:histidine kinase/DNA gyrase B/HSP90-like ATPase
MAMESLPVTVDRSHLIVIGEKLYARSLELVRELVNNAYDADATEVSVQVGDDEAVVQDDGLGMDRGGLLRYFQVGVPDKRENPISPKLKRHRIGQFGIGKFATLAACRRLEVYEELEGGGEAALVAEPKDLAGSEGPGAETDREPGPEDEALDALEPEEPGEPEAPDEGPSVIEAGREARPRVAVVQKVRMGESGLTCCIDQFGEDGPESFTEGTIIYINRDHPLYRNEAAKRETFTRHLARLLTQELALMNEREDPRRAFQQQSLLLKESFSEED